jgi:hypothetical protein
MPFSQEGSRMKTIGWKAASLLLAIAMAPIAMAQSAIPMLVNCGGVLTGANGAPRSGVAGVTFILYKDHRGGTRLWIETQNVIPDRRGHYTVTLGATTSEGLPAYLFANGEARWLATQIAGPGEQPRAPNLGGELRQQLRVQVLDRRSTL